MKLKDTYSWKESYDHPRQHIRRRPWHPAPLLLPGESQGWGSLIGSHLWGRTWLKLLSSSSRQHIKKQRHYFVNKGPSSQGYGFSSGHVWIWELDYKESWALKNWCFWTVVLEKTLESPLDCKEIQPVHPKENQSWIFIWTTDAEAETPILWPPGEKLTHWKRPWCWERLKAGGERDNRGWDGWMAPPTRWTWIWASSGSWWWTGMPMQSMGSQRVGHNWATALTEIWNSVHFLLAAVWSWPLWAERFWPRHRVTMSSVWISRRCRIRANLHMG